MRISRRRLSGAWLRGTRIATSPCDPTENGWTAWLRRDRSKVGIPSLSNRLFTTTASAPSHRWTSASDPSSRGLGLVAGNRMILAGMPRPDYNDWTFGVEPGEDFFDQ